MRVAIGLEALEASSDPLFIVVGVFDGLHRGHAYLLRHLAAEARRRAARPTVITFDHHPDEVLIGAAPPLLCDPDERVARLAAAGVATTVIVHFDQELRLTTYDAFVARIAARAPLAGFLMTPDAAFGYRREGTPATLSALGTAKGFEVVVVPPFDLDGHPVRSTEVRAAIASGDLARAGRLLGRPHAVTGSADMGPASVGFELPVALPPVGGYDVRAGGAWAPRWRGRADRATVGEGSVVLASAMPAGRVRIAFEAGREADR